MWAKSIAHTTCKASRPLGLRVVSRTTSKGTCTGVSILEKQIPYRADRSWYMCPWASEAQNSRACGRGVREPMCQLIWHDDLCLIWDLHRWLKDAFGFEFEVSYVPLTLKIPRTGVVKETQYPIIWPHIWAAACWKAGGNQFSISALGAKGDSALERFWSHVAAHTSWGASHPALAGEDPLDSIIPVRLHGDCARYQKRLSSPSRILILSTSSAMTTGCSWDTRWLFSLLDTRRMVKGIRPSNLHPQYTPAPV